MWGVDVRCFSSPIMMLRLIKSYAHSEANPNRRRHRVDPRERRLAYHMEVTASPQYRIRSPGATPLLSSLRSRPSGPQGRPAHRLKWGFPPTCDHKSLRWKRRWYAIPINVHGDNVRCCVSTVAINERVLAETAWDITCSRSIVRD
jgi:hypothetical protein